MRQIFLVAILSLVLLNKSVACLNEEESGTYLKDGTRLYKDQVSSIPQGHVFNEPELRTGLKRLDGLYKTTKDLDYLSDKGLVLILLKQYNEAISPYLELEKIQPNRYSTASNIGTAYELAGQNANALKWIKKSVQLDPQAHKNSEWIHVNILEAKIKGEQYYTTSFLLNTKFGTTLKPESTMVKAELQNLYKALYYQLDERLSFVKPKEKIVAQLLFDLGNTAFLLGRYNDALSIYYKAKNYGYASELIEQRMKEVERLSKVPKK